MKEFIRAQYPGDIIPGYYTDKNHWCSLFWDSAVPDDITRAMLHNGYETTLASLTKKVRAAILEK
ncbi:hypothetical protein SDC9_85920 [bioreactor metagenome]|uniref:MmcQ/YjbR family DNA-binding protein n=1 Tax=bioreactor metagenome TaxID=1076179 RepID=A0A644ZF05_9ZZZZ|nr:hypothetical protein [Christensenella sp.]